MPLIDKVTVQSAGLDAEELFFRKQEQERMKALRAKSEQETGAQYREEHQNHCFRCGTPSLVEVDHGDIKIDICVNENCGAVHLDPGELDTIIKAGAPAIKRMQMAVFNIFK
jgi:hypothetical protein